MKSINKKAQATFAKIYETAKANTEKEGTACKIQNNAAFMAVNCDILGEVAENENGRIVAVALSHYYKHDSGDMIPDPDMEFYAVENKAGKIVAVLPATYQDFFGRKSALEFESRTGQFKINAREQGRLAVFAGQWLENIRQQQNL